MAVSLSKAEGRCLVCVVVGLSKGRCLVSPGLDQAHKYVHAGRCREAALWHSSSQLLTRSGQLQEHLQGEGLGVAAGSITERHWQSCRSLHTTSQPVLKLCS